MNEKNNILLLLILFINNIQGLESFDRGALMEKSNYLQLTSASQNEKDDQLRNAAGEYVRDCYKPQTPISRELAAIALLAGACPNDQEHASFRDQTEFPHTTFLRAISENDVSLVSLFFEKGLQAQNFPDRPFNIQCPWIYCKSVKMARVLINNGIPLIYQKSPSALVHALINNPDLNYINFLLTKEPRAVHANDNHNPLLIAALKSRKSIKNGSKKDLLESLIDSGADLHYKLDNHRRSTLKALQRSFDKFDHELATHIEIYFNNSKIDADILS